MVANSGANGRPVIPAVQQVRLTIVSLKVPFLRRLFALFNGELVLAVMGTVQDVAVVSRSEAQDILAQSHQQKWVPYRDAHASDPTPMQGPKLS
jgi:hypothetical protein